MNRGLYIHIPFCEKKCNYCAFYSLADLKRKGEYLLCLEEQIKSFREKRVSVDTLYFGGGTPSLLEADELEKIIDAVRENFVLTNDAEITLEANPDSLSGEKLSRYRSLGVNRLSIGAQSFSNATLASLGRRHTREDTERAVALSRECGFDNISLDLIFSLPLEFGDDFSRSLDRALALCPDHISLYALSIEEKTVFEKLKREGKITLPDEEAIAEEYFSACEKLRHTGYDHYEISNFSKPSKASRHNMKYWRGEEYVGIGAGAHSYFDGERYSAPSSIERFLRGEVKEESYKNTPLDRAEEFVFLSLRLSLGLDTKRLTEEFSIPLADEFKSVVRELEEGGFAKFKDGVLSLTEKGFFVEGTVILKILDSLKFPLDF